MPKNGQDEVQALRKIIELTGLLNSTLNLDELLQLIMTSAAELLNAETSSLLLHDEDAGDLIIHVATGASGEQVSQQRVPAGQGIAGWVMEKGEVAVVENPRDDPRFFAGMDEATGFETRNILALPLKVRDRTVGVVEVINKHEGGRRLHRHRPGARERARQPGRPRDRQRPLYAKRQTRSSPHASRTGFSPPQRPSGGHRARQSSWPRDDIHG